MQPLFEIEIFWPDKTDFLVQLSFSISEEGMHMTWQYQISSVPNK